MKLNKLSIRWKITLLNMLLLTAVSFLLYIGANNSADRAMESIPMTQLVAQPDQDPVQPVPLQTPLQTAKKTHRIEMGFYLFATILAGGLMTFIISKQSLKQLEEFEQCIRDTDPHKLSEKIIIHQPDPEIACLVDSFNNMTDKLEESFAQQKLFSHNVAHELRTPLTVLRTKLDVFQKKNRTPEEYQVLLELMDTYTRHLSDMVENILQYSDVSNMPRQDRIPLGEMLSQVVSEIQAVYPQTDIQIEAGDAFCIGNAVLLRCVFTNLVENACRYGQGGDGIIIGMTMQHETITIQISDNGPGISDHDKAHIFEPFYRVDKSRSREYGGTGLGLFFCREIISGHGGAISVSDHKTTGTTFTITLPA